MRKPLALLAQVALALALVFAGRRVATRLIETAPEVKRVASKSPPRPAAFRRARFGTYPVTLVAHGALRPSREVTLKPDVAGAVTWVSPDLVPGRAVPAGRKLFEIDRRGYALEVARAKAALAQAEQGLALERGRARVAQKEWDLFAARGGPPRSAQARRLALREPQRLSAEAAVAVAKTGVDRAALDLRRTSVLAPFDALVAEKFVELGARVGPADRLVRLVATASAWVELALTPRQLGRLDPDRPEGEVTASLGGREVTRPARALHLLPALDPAVRLARVLVEVDRPFDDAAGGGRLLLGDFVTARLPGRPLTRVLALPREDLRGGDSVYVLDDEDRLRVRAVRVAWEEGDTVYVEGDVAEGARVVAGYVPAPTPGTRYDPQAAEAEADHG